MTGAIVGTELRLLAREPVTLLFSLLFPVVLMVLVVSSFGSEPDPAFGGISGTDLYVPVYATAAIAVMGFLGVPTHLAAYRETGVLHRLRAAGVGAPVVLSAQLAVSAVVVGTGLALMLGLGFGAFSLSAPQSPAGVGLALVVGTLSFTAIGVLLGALLPTARAAQGLGMLLFFGLFFVSGGGPPPQLLPDALNTAADLTPMGMVVDAISDPWHGRGSNVPALLALAVIGAASAALATRRLARAAAA